MTEMMLKRSTLLENTAVQCSKDSRWSLPIGFQTLESYTRVWITCRKPKIVPENSCAMPIVGSGSRRNRNTNNTSRGGGRGRGAAPKSRGFFKRRSNSRPASTQDRNSTAVSRSSSRGGSSSRGSRGRFSFRRSGNNRGSSRPRGSGGRNSFRRGGPTMRVPMKRHDANGNEYTEYKEVSTLTFCVTILILLGLVFMFNTPSDSVRNHTVPLLPETTFDVSGTFNARQFVRISNAITGTAYLCPNEPTLGTVPHYNTQSFTNRVEIDGYIYYNIFLHEKTQVFMSHQSSWWSRVSLEAVKGRTAWNSWTQGALVDEQEWDNCNSGGCVHNVKNNDYFWFTFENHHHLAFDLYAYFDFTYYLHDLSSCTELSCSLADCRIDIPDGQKVFVVTPSSPSSRVLYVEVVDAATGGSTRVLGVLLLALGIVGAVFSCMIEYKKHSSVNEYNNASNSLPSDPKGVQPPPIQPTYPGSIP
ncbi:hypothetical protein GEMRC1_003609 [Eukaryota sp. GEM-RC1]